MPSPEHFVTLFDSNYLPMGLALHDSLLRHGRPFHLWILCMDVAVAENLNKLNLESVSLISLRDVENEALRSVKSGRTRGEYCWTLTPFTFDAVFAREASAHRVTYLDADLFFFADPRSLLDEMDDRHHVLITDHAYDPKYDQTAVSGRFCVQFLSVRRTPEGIRVMRWWQDRCLEWCFDRVEDGKFGDQKYLDQWPTLFAGEVQIVAATHRTLAPWNVAHFGSKAPLDPVFFHFHGLRFVAPSQVQLFNQYAVGKSAAILYDAYLVAIGRAGNRMRSIGISPPVRPLPRGIREWARRARRQFLGLTRFATLRS